jgi:hypothetical protein
MIGIIDDPANRYLASNLTEEMPPGLSRHLVYCHIKNVKLVSENKKNIGNTFQEVGKRRFIFSGRLYEWSNPASGDINIKCEVRTAFHNIFQ